MWLSKAHEPALKPHAMPFLREPALPRMSRGGPLWGFLGVKNRQLHQVKIGKPSCLLCARGKPGCFL